MPLNDRKIITIILEQCRGIEERCDGYLMFGRRMFRCAHVHGKVDMRAAIAESCNIYFTHVAEAVGMDRLARMAGEFGLGMKTGIGVNPEAAGRVLRAITERFPDDCHVADDGMRL